MPQCDDKGSVKKKFLKSVVKDRPMTLYHGMPSAAEGDEIRTSLRYGTMIAEDVRSALGVTAEKPPLVFASDHPSKALAFALDGRGGEVMLNMSLPDIDCELVIVTERDKTMMKSRDAALYAFPADGFAKLLDRQFVSAKPVPLSRAKKVDIKSTDDLMRAGLQVFSFKETRAELNQDPEFWPLFDKGSSAPEGTLAAISYMMKTGRIVWENKERGINPRPEMEAALSVAAPEQVQNKKARPFEGPGS